VIAPGYWLFGYGIVAVVMLAAKVARGHRYARAELRPWPVFLRYVFVGRGLTWWARTVWVALARPLAGTLFSLGVVVAMMAYALLWIAEAMVRPWDR
jgi:hypothetical protein